MLEKRLKKKNFKLLIYIVGAIIEFIGFGFLFAFDKTIQIVSSYHIIFSLLIIFFGYLLCISMRWRPPR